jgi:hypothetical protein
MKKIIAGIIASAALAGAANATLMNTATQTFNFGGTTDFSGSLAFQLFDSSLGALTGVTISDSYGFTTTITVTNSAASAKSGGATTSSSLQLGGADAAATAVSNALNSNTIYDSDFNAISASAGGNTGTVTFQNVGSGPANAVTKGPFNVSSNTVSTTLSGDLASFVGTGTSTLNYTTYTFTTVQQQGGNLTAQQSTTGNGIFSIFYTYDATTSAVPEPATWALMIGGFGLVGYGMRRRGTSVVFN